ncbi:MAG: hypothetical protein EOM55_00300 [Clostridia bacterium]|nr:hypothetical protein [Clostridia bacterium]
MSKKVLILIQIAVVVIAVIIISLYGRNPENWKDFNYCEEVYFLVDGEKVANDYELELQDGTITYQLVWYVGPENSTIKTVRFSSDNSNVSVGEGGLLTFLMANEGAVITIFTTDNSLLSRRIIISFGPPSGGQLPL